MKNFLGVFATAIILLLTGCASVQMAPPEMDIEAKEFITPPNKAALYIYRSESFGAAVPMTVSVNGKVLGRTPARTYFRMNVKPGQYKVESFTEDVSTLPLTLEADKNYFVWQEAKMGMLMREVFYNKLMKRLDELV